MSDEVSKAKWQFRRKRHGGSVASTSISRAILWRSFGRVNLLFGRHFMASRPPPIARELAVSTSTTIPKPPCPSPPTTSRPSILKSLASFLEIGITGSGTGGDSSVPFEV
eukprot:CAMPEP_0171767746 /NCGR_PEP_ID=MMETSP0991-20121206/52004_1 /TAXON_ID=483369 /ORGANISM="non described non described, Strain CCMP2098" /LENGTH=109 /DNA_ID=CAMNT_0012372597 /DNA_START=59 /DNA_END=388 /DNA_ORIENTATION=-